MKTTKKGFTLIELIVVIAIIGVLAAILVPTMLGYVRKSKISSANSTASSIYKAINSALTELDEEGVDVSGLYFVCYNSASAQKQWAASKSTEPEEIYAADLDNVTDPTDDMVAACGTGKDFDKKVANFFSDIKKLDKNGEVKAFIKDGSAIACAARADKTYTGTYPAGVVTSDTYTSYKDKVDLAVKDAMIVYYGGKVKEKTQS